MDNLLFWIVPAASIVALLFARIFYVGMMKESEGTERMARIASHVRTGAMSYLRQQYKIVGVVFIILAIVFAIMAYGFQAPECMGACGVPDGRFLLRAGRFPRNEDSH